MNAKSKHENTARTSRTRRNTAWSMTCAVLLTAILLGCASCTRDEVLHDPKETGAGTTAGTLADTRPSGGTNGGMPGTGKPLDPEAGTVNPNGDAGDPPAGTGKGDAAREFRSKFMH